jgi:MioC protein
LLGRATARRYVRPIATVAATEAGVAEKLTILVGTMTGTAEMVAEEMSDALGETGFAVDVKPMDGLNAAVFAPGGLYLVCSSTYGQGDVPDNATNLYNGLCAKKPDLKNVRYGVFSLGDRTYAETFNFGGECFDELLRELGAQRIGERVQHDASSGVLPEEVAVEWGQGWLALAKDAVAVST